MKLDMKQMLHSTLSFLSAHKEQIELGAGGGLIIGSFVWIIKDQPNVEQIILNEKEYRVLESGVDESADGTKSVRVGQVESIDIPWKDRIKLTWKRYLVPTGMLVGGFALILLARKSEKDVSSAFAAAYTASQTNLKDLQDTVNRTIGDSKKKKEEFDKAKSEVFTENHPAEEGKNVYGVEGADTPILFLDSYTGEYFWSSLSNVVKACAIYNSRVVNYFDNYEPYNTFRELTNRKGPCISKFADSFGHNSQYLMEIPDIEHGENFESTVITSGMYEGHPALIFEEIGDGPILLKGDYHTEEY